MPWQDRSIQATPSPRASLGSAQHVRNKQQLSRLLYSNAVCMLSTGVRPAHTSRSRVGCRCDLFVLVSGEHGGVAPNVMTISWLTPYNNSGGIVLSINANRHTATKLRAHPQFVLNVPTSEMEAQVLQIGKCSGRDTNKFQSLSIRTCTPGGWVDRNDASESSSLVAIADAVCHIVCTVKAIEECEGHMLTRAQMLEAWVHEGYWDGANFVPRGKDLPPLLSFLGSQKFVYMHARPEAPSEFHSEQDGAAVPALLAEIGRVKQKNAAKEREIQRLRELCTTLRL